MIPLVAVLTAFLSGSLLGIVLADRRTRRRQNEDRAKRVADALADTVLVDGIELPKPEDERWELKEIKFATQIARSLVNGPVILVGAEICGRSYVCVAGVPISRHTTVDQDRYTAAVWRAYQNRVVAKAIQP